MSNSCKVYLLFGQTYGPFQSFKWHLVKPWGLFWNNCYFPLFPSRILLARCIMLRLAISIQNKCWNQCNIFPLEITQRMLGWQHTFGNYIMNFDRKEHSKEKIFDAAKSNIYLSMENKVGNYKIKEKHRFINRALHWLSKSFYLVRCSIN